MSSSSSSATHQHVHGVAPSGVRLPTWAARRLPVGLQYLLLRVLSAATRLETSTDIGLTISRLKVWKPTRWEKARYAFMLFMATLSMYIMAAPPFPWKLAIPALYTLALLLPITSQFFLPASPILLWLLVFYSSQFVNPASRPHIWVSVLPTLETIWYGASISDILTHFGHPALDILAWFPYGVIHFAAPFFVAAALFVFAPPGATKVFGSAFGFMNLVGVMVQFGFPCAPPWYELREGLTPANYSMKGSPAGLARIDALFGGHGYTLTFSNAPVPFGAFPSLHAGCATMEALFLSYFFPVAISLRLPGRSGKRLQLDARVLYWAYAFWLFWCTMYLMHHYLVDLVGGACLSTATFYFFLTDEMREEMEQHYAFKPSTAAPLSAAPPICEPNSGFGTRASVDANRASLQLSGFAMDDLGRGPSQTSSHGHEGKHVPNGNGAVPHVLFNAPDEHDERDWDSDGEGEAKAGRQGAAEGE